jgi:hypothetical protein
MGRLDSPGRLVLNCAQFTQDCDRRVNHLRADTKQLQLFDLRKED